MFSPFRLYGSSLEPRVIVLALTIGMMSGTSVFAQTNALYGNRGYVPYYGGYRNANPGYNIYGNFGVYGYPGSGPVGGAVNSGYDPGYGGYPSYGGYGIVNSTGSPARPARLLGIDEEPVVMADGAKAMKVGKVFPGTAAEKAGLQAGDVIRSVNGYLTEQRGNLAWVIANAAPKNELKLTVQGANDKNTRVISATLP
jgi:membrane-associated protease RseP (regulator of RpoE activity)